MAKTLTLSIISLFIFIIVEQFEINHNLGLITYQLERIADKQAGQNPLNNIAQIELAKQRINEVLEESK